MSKLQNCIYLKKKINLEISKLVFLLKILLICWINLQFPNVCVTEEFHTAGLYDPA